jgi:hypothetical protein
MAIKVDVEWNWVRSETHRKDEFHKPVKRDLVLLLQVLLSKAEDPKQASKADVNWLIYQKTKEFYQTL